MKVYYASLAGKTRNFVQRSGFEHTEIVSETEVNEDFVLVIYTFGFGEIPKGIREFLEYKENYRFMKGVASSGNLVWGENFGLAADKISDIYDVPVLLKFHQVGTDEDIALFREKVLKMEV